MIDYTVNNKGTRIEIVDNFIYYKINLQKAKKIVLQKNMLKENIDTNKISKVTGLNAGKINELK